MITDFDAAELTRRLANIVRLGTIETVDTTYAFATVKIGNITTRPLPWMTLAAGQDRSWRAPSIGEQVVILSQSGDLNNGVILCGGIYTETNPAPSDKEPEWLLLFRDGARISYNAETSKLEVTGFQDVEIQGTGNASVTIGGSASVTIGGSATIDVTGNTNITTPTLALDGDMTCTGQITAQGDVIGEGVSLSTHVHGGVQSGKSQTTPPI